MRAALRHTDAAGFVVELTMQMLSAFRSNRVFSPLVYLLANSGEPNTLDSRAIEISRRFIEPIVDYLPDPSFVDLDEMTETLIRIQLSILTLDSARTRSPAKLRAYLHRVLPPALGVPAAAVPIPASRSKR